MRKRGGEKGGGVGEGAKGVTTKWPACHRLTKLNSGSVTAAPDNRVLYRMRLGKYLTLYLATRGTAEKLYSSG